MAATPPRRSWQDVAFLFAGVLVVLGGFLIATRLNRRLHSWMLSDRVDFAPDKRVSPGYRQAMTSAAPVVGLVFVVAGLFLFFLALFA